MIWRWIPIGYTCEQWFSHMQAPQSHGQTRGMCEQQCSHATACTQACVHLATCVTLLHVRIGSPARHNTRKHVRRRLTTYVLHALVCSSTGACSMPNVYMRMTRVVDGLDPLTQLARFVLQMHATRACLVSCPYGSLF